MPEWTEWFPIQLSILGGRRAKIKYLQGPSVGDGGSSLIHPATVTLTDDDIKALGVGDGFTIVPAPGANLMIQLLSASAVLDSTAGAYVGAESGTGWALFSPTVGANYATSLIPMESVLGAAASVTLVWASMFGRDAVRAGSGDFANTMISKHPTTAPVNKALELADWWAAGAYTGGHASNTCRVSVAYLLLNVSTGVYV